MAHPTSTDALWPTVLKPAAGLLAPVSKWLTTRPPPQGEASMSSSSLGSDPGRCG